MAQQTSRMYGVKVKEKVNYYEFGDAGTGKQITLSYENKVWTVKAGGKQDPSVDVSWFRDGNEYHKGDTIVTFNDGDEVTYHIMEQDRSETPYINLMYDIFGNMAMNVEYGNKDVYYRIVPGTKQYSCKVYEFVNGIIHSSKEFTSEDIVNYKKIYKDLKANPLYPVYNMLFDWHGMNPESGYPQMSFEAISNSNYIKYNGNTKNKGVTINVWQAVGFLGFEVTDDTNKHQAKKMSKEDSPDVKLVKRHGGLTVQEATKNNKTIFSDVMYDHKDAYYNGHYHDAMYLVYDNPNVDGCWRKKFNSIALTYADPYWFLMTTAAGVEYGGRTYEAQKLIRTWKPETSVNMTLKETISRRKAIPDNENYDKFIYHVVEEEGSDAVFVYYNQIVTVEDEEGIHDEQVQIDSVGFTSSQAPVTYKHISFKIKNGSWTIFSGNQYITYEGKEAKTNQALKSFPIRGAINIEIGDNSDKKGAAADKFVYDVEEIGGNDSITVKFQQVANQRDPEGHSRKTYIDLDQRTFTSGDSPVTFRNIQFKASNGKWTIYSKCGYIKYNGRMYPNNRSILSFAISEAIHIEIADESNIYEIKEQRIYNIKTPNSEVIVGYSIITSEMTRALKLVKMSGDKEEPWVTVNFYEAMYKPYVYDDISVRYDAKETKWELYSNSDDLYLNGTNYKLGSKIGESWSYYTFVRLTGITVVHTNNEALQASVQIIKDGKVVKNVDIDEDIGWYDPEDLDFHLGYSYAKGLWVFRAIHNCWVDGINYSTGSVIKSFKTRLNVDQFTMMFRHYDDEEHPDIPTNVLYYITTSVDPFSGVTTVDINCPGHGSNSYSDKDTSKEADKAYTFTKQDAKSMYGYIWKRFGGPTPPPSIDIYEILIPITYSDYYGYENNIVGITRNLDEISSTWHNTSSINAGLDFMGKVSTRIYYSASITGNGRSLLFANLNGSEWDEVDGFDPGAIIGLINMTTAVVYNYVTERIQVYNVFSSARKSIDNDSSESISNRSSLELIDASSISNVVLKGSWSGWDFFIYDFETNSITDHISDKVRLDAEEARAIYDYYHYDPSTGWIDRQQILGYSVGIEPYTFVLNKRVYCFMRRVYVHYNGGYIHTPEGRIEYDVADWECCAYTIDKNGISSIHKNVMTPEGFDEFVYRPGKSGPFEHNGAYYFIYNTDDPETAYITIASFDPTTFSFAIAKTINKDSYILVRNFISGRSSDYIKVYFDGRAYSYENNEIGIGGLSYTYSKGSYVYSTKQYPGSSKKLYIFFANPLLETNPGNFVMSEDTRFRD